MAAARERNDDSYEDGGGFGKFRKRPFRRVQGTPYDRPPTAIRNSSHAYTNNNNGWLSKLVDPAHRLITSSAHKLFSSVFRKRLPPPPPPQPPELEANGGAPDKQQEAVGKDLPGIRGSAIKEIDNPGSSSDGVGLTELEIILKQKTFTRSEIDRLTALLQSRTVDVDLHVGNQEKKSEVIPLKGLFFLDRKEFPSTPVKDEGLESHHVSTANVLDEDVASPAELAKAYMGSRPSKISPSVLGLHSKPMADNSIVQIDQLFPSKSPIASVVPRSSGHVVSVENGFLRPRSRGRSAIYSMARTPYSKVQSTSTPQGSGTEANVLGSPSFLSQSMRENSRFSGSKQGPVKRRSSVLDNDVGSVGPIRRIRQKSNLVPSITLSMYGNGLGSDAAQRPSLTQKQALASGTSIENGDNSSHQGSRFTPIPSKSSEMASKILQQLDVLVSSREKSPTKLSSSALRGPALRSLENVDSSKFVETVHDNNKMDVKQDTSLPGVRDSLCQKQDVEGNSPKKFIASYEKSASEVNGIDPTNLVKNNTSDLKAISFPANSVAQPLPPPQKKRAFQMSAHEDYLELGDDDHFSASATLAEKNEKLVAALAENKASSGETIKSGKVAAFSQVEPQGRSIFNPKPPGASDRSAVAEKSSGFSIPASAPLPSTTVRQAVADKQATLTSGKASSPNESSDAPIFNLGDKSVYSKEPNVTGLKFGTSSPRLESSSREQSNHSCQGVVAQAQGAPGPRVCASEPQSFAFNAVDARSSGTKEPEPDTNDNGNSLKAGAFSNSIRSFSSPDPALLPDNIAGQSSSSSSNSSVFTTPMSTTTPNTTNSSNISVSASAPSFESKSAFKFGSSLVSSTSSMSSTPAPSGAELTQPKKETSFSDLVSAPFASTYSISTGASLFGGTSSAIASMGSNIFNDTSSAVASTGSSTFTSSSVASTGSGIFSFNAGSSTSVATTQSQGPFSAGSAQASGPGSVFSATTQSMPIQFSSSASSPFGLTANVAPSSGSSLFSSSTSVNKLFSSGAATSFGVASSTSSEANPVGSASSSMSTVFGSSWQTPKSPIFNSGSSSTGFSFGASSASNATSTASMVFASPTSASSGTVFSFSSAATATPQPVFGNPHPAFTFGSSPSGNGDQVNMEDSMAEDTVQATTSTVPLFGQQPIAPPSSGFVFGSTAVSGGNQFGSTAPSGGSQFGTTAPSGTNPFQFATQPNLAASQNQSPFQASGSLEFNAAGSFSLGSGGGDKSGRKIIRVRKTQRKK
ncbi:hypothetical protein MANES_07G084000v8 [Manihot esculenta]|uniref:Uncharacterized protein n=1 Tax=Manihot esculenta TaxID=3983 RepID=A0ACB7HEA8_MANES|nr:hypothetical protein MANES_07G084000v8 [Manihot esculenta]